MKQLFKLLFFCLLFISNVSISQTDTTADKNNLQKTLNSLEQKIENIQNQKQNQELELAKENIERANTIINWSGYILTALALFLSLVGLIGLLEISKIKKIRTDFIDELNSVKKEIEKFNKDKEEILKEAKRFAEVNYFLNQGKQLYAFGQHFEAREHLFKVLSYDPNNITAHYYLGNSYRMENKFDEAIRESEIILKIDPKNADAYYGIAMSYGTNNIEKAIENYNLAIKYNPDHTKAYNRLGTLLRLNNLDEALNTYKKAAKVKNDANTSFNIGLIYYGMGDLKNANKCFIDTKHFAFAEIDNSKSPKWQYHFLAVISGLENNLAEANNFYKKALEIDHSVGVRQGMKSDLDFLLKHVKEKKIKENIKKMISFLEDGKNISS